ncbi:hypothetical protein Aca07nite_12310 [Actinoplanes capillaceus]|uniref:SHOCT domain-containing protein n=1 Tax=Actinoplanes campanulatus TaxID=113559 RepID=A0ABQ3WDE9_9ACTN|nr:SHOCT domain-containing protein [Actinoplanes capillaceus]GID43956.1 hypothetical protein Aca07nite_12310 [Actinoplanes capillaceus]
MPGLLRGMARTAVVAGTATAVSNRVSRRQAGRWAQQAAPQQPPQYYEQAPPPPAHGQAPPATDTSAQLEQLQQLGELKAQGILTEQEFQEQKARILGR